ncbi:ABC transporter permease [Paenibacillus qinlingensis]|uniref:ABC-2 type transport system permease protein n=1 Tax=Paenibacillus qinlingensis TaxID=1837343 RepID=A0ABU1NQ70_9BACL|nr:ABC transporter permease [Paenibacillus qinlingensis]MDR6549568.1 ABC-2 type transport system permease protein [Paenibacillus qinlingensis]
MTGLYALVKNEMIKMIKKKRFYVILLILLALIPMFTYAQMRVAQHTQKQFGTSDWKADQRQKVIDWEKRLSSARTPDEWKQQLRVQIQIANYYLEQDVNPSSPNAVTFTREFVKNAVGLFIPLIIMVISADIVSSEHSTGTIKLLLTRPVRRWKILLSKLITVVFFTSLTVLSTGLICYLISGIVFGYNGWTMPIFTGIQLTGADVDFSRVRAVDQWFFLLMEFGLVWFTAIVVAIMSLMLSVLIRSTAAGMGVMLAVLISGTILSNMVSSWETAKYLFMVNLDLTKYLTGGIPPIQGMDLGFSLSVLSVWTVLALIVSFTVFSRKDILN